MQDILPSRLASEIVTLIPRTALQLIDGAGHMPFWERPELFFRTVGDFLDSKDRGI
jgi:pimeloyl-ACP methyl ester carboxylesterase